MNRNKATDQYAFSFSTPPALNAVIVLFWGFFHSQSGVIDASIKTCVPFTCFSCSKPLSTTL